MFLVISGFNCADYGSAASCVSLGWTAPITATLCSSGKPNATRTVPPTQDFTTLDSETFTTSGIVVTEFDQGESFVPATVAALMIPIYWKSSDLRFLPARSAVGDRVAIGVAVPVSFLMVLVLLTFLLFRWRKMRSRENMARLNHSKPELDASNKPPKELQTEEIQELGHGLSPELIGSIPVHELQSQDHDFIGPINRA